MPSNAEWTQLTNYVSSQNEYVCGSSTSDIAKALASSFGWEESSSACAVGNTQSSNNATGFSAVPAGGYLRYSYGGNTTWKYGNFGTTAFFWSTDQTGIYGNYKSLIFDSAFVNGGWDEQDYLSVRCLRD